MQQKRPANFYDDDLSYRRTYKRQTGPVKPLPQKPPRSMYPKPRFWNYEKDCRLLALYRTKLSMTEVAEKLSEEYGVIISRGQIAGRIITIRRAV